MYTTHGHFHANKYLLLQILQIPDEIRLMTDAELVRALTHLNYVPGPITVHSRSLYERIYVRLLNDMDDVCMNIIT